MTSKDYQLQTTTAEGLIQVLQMTRLHQSQASSVIPIPTLFVASQAGFQYKLVDTETGGHLKG